MWIISYKTESGDQDKLPYTFKDEPTHDIATRLVVAYCTWEFDGISYISDVNVEKIEIEDKPLDNDGTTKLLDSLSIDFKEETGCSLEDSDPICGF